jgi:hypothetical protein
LLAWGKRRNTGDTESVQEAICDVSQVLVGLAGVRQDLFLAKHHHGGNREKGNCSASKNGLNNSPVPV